MTASSVRPLRWIETITEADGCGVNQRVPGVGMSPIRSCLVVAAVVAKDGNRITSIHYGGVGETDLKLLMAERDVITSDEIENWFDLFKGRLKPEKDDLQDLATALNIMRITDRAPADTADISRRAVKNDIAALLRDLPTLIETELRNFELRANSSAAKAHGLTVRKAFADLLSAAQQADKFLGRRAQRRRETAWFGDALWIAAHLRMLGEKNGQTVGLTKDDSPGVQFIARALKRACPKDSVTDFNIARAMHRHKELVKPWTPSAGV